MLAAPVLRNHNTLSAVATTISTSASSSSCTATNATTAPDSGDAVTAVVGQCPIMIIEPRSTLGATYTRPVLSLLLMQSTSPSLFTSAITNIDVGVSALPSTNVWNSPLNRNPSGYSPPFSNATMLPEPTCNATTSTALSPLTSAATMPLPSDCAKPYITLYDALNAPASTPRSFATHTSMSTDDTCQCTRPTQSTTPLPLTSANAAARADVVLPMMERDFAENVPAGNTEPSEDTGVKSHSSGGSGGEAALVSTPPPSTGD